MATKSEQIIARKAQYDRVETAASADGRLIGVKRLKPSQQLRIREWAPNLDGMNSIVDPETGKTIEIPKIMPLMLAASVCEIDRRPIPFPKSRAELDAMLDSLDDDGQAAAMEAMSLLIKGDQEMSTGSIEDEAKNSAETPA